MLKAPVQDASGKIGQFAFHDDLYGQCWTLHKTSDAMWRIYSPKKEAVRIRTTIDKLAKSVSESLGDWAHTQCFIGKVSYLSEKRLKSFAASIFKNGLSAEASARSLLVKRWAFNHEREIRLLYFEKANTKHRGGLYRYGIDPHSLVDQIMVDPRLTADQASISIQRIRARTRFRGEIKRSLLYQPPKGFVVKIP